MTATAINTHNTATSNNTNNKRANSELEPVSSQNTDSNAVGGGRKKSIRVEDPQYFALPKHFM